MQSTNIQSVSLRQRNYIQGLRGLAVLAVVFYHANLWVHGGFVGVDIFFVISGYVIFNSLISEYSNTKKIDIRDFVSRRVRRLLPAFSVMSICTLIATVFILSPFGEQQQVSRTSQAASLFGANVYLAIQNSYFALVNNPFRHTWTLAVEEQFYIFLILFLALLVYVARRKSLNFLKLATITLIILGLGSFAISTVFSYGFRIIPLPTRVAFFSFPTRTWEFIVGILVSLSGITRVQEHKSKLTIHLSTTSGILLIIYALLNFNTFTNFPGFAALFPVVGTALLIWTSDSKSYLSFIFGSKFFVWIGDVSYSWYLWHWPMIVFSLVLWPGNRLAVLIAAFGSLLPASLSYNFIENRFRLKSSSVKSKISTVQIALLSIGLPLVVSIVVMLGAETGYGLKRSASLGLTDSLAYRSGCQMDVLPFPADSCVFTQSIEGKLVLLIGDSQAGTNSNAVYSAAKSLGFNFAVWYDNGCPIFPRPTVERSDCGTYLAALPLLIQKLNPSIIVIANSSTLYTTAGAQRGGLTITNETGKPPSTYQDAIEIWIRGLTVTLSQSDLMNRQVVIFGQIPPSRFLSPSILRPQVSTQSFDLSSSSDRNLIVSKELETVSQFPNTILFDSSRYLCPNAKCHYAVHGNDVYADSLHLTVEGSMLLSEGIKITLQSLTK